MRIDGTPLCVKDLKVDGNDLVALGVDEKQRGKFLEELWLDTVMNPDLIDRDKALAYLKKKQKSV